MAQTEKKTEAQHTRRYLTHWCGGTREQAECGSSSTSVASAPDKVTCPKCRARAEKVAATLSVKTPGPWTVEGEGCPFYVAAGGVTIAEVEAVTEIPRHVAGEDECNARMIAAAPELLEALRMQRCSQCMESESAEVVCDACRARRAAIAKAEGR